MDMDLRRKRKMGKATEFVERMRKVQKEAGVVLVKAQKEMKIQMDRRRKEVEVWKVREKVMSSMKDLVFKERPARKLMDQYIGLYTIDEIMSTYVVKLQLPTSIRIHLVVDTSKAVQYKDQVEGQRKEEVKPIEIEGVKE